MKIILLFGAGKSATVLIQYLLEKAPTMDWNLLVADTDLALINQKIAENPRGLALCMDVKNATERENAIAKADLVISLLPPSLHILVARGCLKFNKHLFTASYLDKEVEQLEPEIRNKGLLFLYEMGLDPGIDHMSAMAILDKIKSSGGTIKSFVSHCGGLVAPQSDTNPWHYKISWNPANVVAAGKQGALYKQDKAIIEWPYENIFDQIRTVEIENAGTLAWYPNRNSIPYISLYRLDEAETFSRTTLRHPAFMKGWKKMIQLGLTQDDPVSMYAAKHPVDIIFQMLTANGQIGQYQHWLKEDPLFKEQVMHLGLQSTSYELKKAEYSPASLIQELLESALKMADTDQDRVIMQHEIHYRLNAKDHYLVSSLVLDGKNAAETAMAKTVGLPLAIAATLFLQNKIDLLGLQRPLSPMLYQQVLPALAKEGVLFTEREKVIN